MTVRLLSYNIRYGGVGREDALSEVIRDSAADIVILQEATHPTVVERLASATGMSAWAARPGHSLAFMSRLDIAHYEWHEIPVTRRRYLEVVLAANNARIFGVHLRAVHANWSERRRVRELRALLENIAQCRDTLHILTGDFNTLAPGAILDARQLPLRLQTLLWLSGRRIRWETIQIMLDAEYEDGYRLLHPLEDGFTFPAWNPHVRLDYVFVPLLFADTLKSCEVMYEGLATGHASDHFPLLSVLDIA